MSHGNSSKRGRWSVSARLLLFFPLAAGGYWILGWAPHLVERLYTPAYRPLASAGSRLTGIVPVSCAETLLVGALVGAFLYAFWRWRALRAGRWTWTTVLRRDGLRLLATLAVIYVAFLAVWGLNYRRLPLSHLSGLTASPAHARHLHALCDALVSRTNTLRATLEEDDAGVAALSSSLTATLNRAQKGFAVAGTRYPELAGDYGAPKGALLSTALSWLGISGIYIPFTAEPHVNTTLPAPALPFTACHEMAHQRGFAREDEANYLGYLACRLHPDADFRYSGTLTATLYAVQALPSDDQTKLFEQLSSAVHRDLDAMRQWRERYRSIASEVSSRVNDAYLRANGQQDGVLSYGRMVDLMLAEWDAEGEVQGGGTPRGSANRR